LQYKFYCMKGLLLSLSVLFFIIFTACEKKTETTPIAQQVVISDTSQYTGSLKVYVKYISNGTLYSAPGNTTVAIYANYEDIQNNLYIYRLFTDNSGFINFGYFNLGNYYVKAEAYVNNQYYTAINAIQIRPRRDEVLTSTMTLVP